jgi:hypothetical protein
MMALLQRPDGGFLLGLLVGFTIALALVWVVLFLFGGLRG